MQHKLLLIVSFALVLATIPVVVGESLAVQQLFEQFKIEHGKYYADPKEEAFRLGVFQQNMKVAEEMNKQNPNALFGVTQFMDLTDDEFAKIQGTSEDFDSNSNVTILNDTSLPSFYQLPDNFEWYNSTNCSPVKNQRQCGSCWAHAAVEAVECVIGITTGKAPILSVQQLVNCATFNPILRGCNGGLPGLALTYVRLKGLVEESTYPYKGVMGRCDYDTNAYRPGKISNWYGTVPSETSFMQLLKKYGPMPIAIDATKWKTYKKGVIERGCWTGSRNHAVLLTGWGVNDRGVKFWNIRNSWDTTWGENGFIRIGRFNNVCGIKDKGIVVTLH
jgi:hypothetical protein